MTKSREEKVTRIFIALVLALFLAPHARAQSCDLPGGQKAESARYVVVYRTKPERLHVGEHFAMELVVCPKSGQPAPESVRLDGFMPEHNHGMNYKAVVKPAGNGRYEAAGLMFHMPGRWDFIFEVSGGGKIDRITHGVTLQ
jgi:hypothetical protein